MQTSRDLPHREERVLLRGRSAPLQVLQPEVWWRLVIAASKGSKHCVANCPGEGNNQTVGPPDQSKNEFD